MDPSRIERLNQAMEEQGLDVVALVPGPSLLYFTGLSFHLSERPILAFFPRGRKPLLILPGLERAKGESSGLEADLVDYAEDPVSRASAFEQASQMLGLSGRRIGIETNRMRVSEHELLRGIAPEAQWSSAAPAISEVRIRKQADEIEAMRRAVTIAQEGLHAALPFARIGMSEKEFAAELVLQLLRAGSDPELPFGPIVASGPNSALPHASPGNRKFQAGDLLVLDWGASSDHYVSDLTRTFAIAEVPMDLTPVHEAVQEANAAGRAAARPGITCGAVDKAAREVINAAGYGEFFIHRTGHGIGLEPHEPPYLMADSQELLAPGMTTTVEPGIYIQGKGGVRIEDDVLVTQGGSESLSDLSRSLEVIA